MCIYIMFGHQAIHRMIGTSVTKPLLQGSFQTKHINTVFMCCSEGTFLHFKSRKHFKYFL